MARKEMNLAILGYGGMGYWHAQHATKVEGVNLIGSYDINPHAYDDSPHIPVYESEDALFQDPRVNTVLLTVPNHLHKQYAIKAARCGKNILCEKPAALNVRCSTSNPPCALLTELSTTGTASLSSAAVCSMTGACI